MVLALSAGLICFNFDRWFVHPVFSGKEKTGHLIVISVDALNSRDYEQISALPNFRKLLDRGAYAREVEGVYPSLTYPAHTTIVTGVYPDKHGIVNNEVFQAGAGEMDWFWFKKYIRVPTLYDIAGETGMKTGALLWPATGRADISYNMPEIKAHEGQSQLWAVLSNGSPLFLLDCQMRFGKLRKGINQPELDNFVTASAKHLIVTKKPNILLIHLTDLDDHRHRYGTMSGEAQKALERQDERIGEIVQAAADAGIYDQSTFIVLGDHGFLDFSRSISLNAVFRREGLISVDSAGRLLDWKAFLHSCDGSAYVYLKDGSGETRQKVEQILMTLKKDVNSGIGEVYSREDMAGLRTGGEADFMLEAREGYCFDNRWDGEFITTVMPGKTLSGKEPKVATHGYLLNKPGYHTFFMMSGPGVKKGAVLQKIRLIDEAPTMAALLGLEMPLAEGKVLEDLLE